MALARPQIEVKEGRSEWFWHLQDRNGKLIATSGETFSSKAAAERAARNARKTFPFARVEIVD